MWLDTFIEMRKLSGMSLDELSAKSGVPKGTLTKITSGLTKSPTLDTMRSLVYAMGYSLKDLDDGLEKSNSLSKVESEHIQKYRTLDDYGKEAVDSILDVEYRRIMDAKTDKSISKEHNIIRLPFVVDKASAGLGFNFLNYPQEEWKVILNEFTRKADFCVCVTGDSMKPKISDGDIILVRHQDSVDIGEIGLFSINNNGFVKKQGENRLISINPDCDDVYPSEYDTVRCYGKFLGILQPDWIVDK